MANRAPEGPRFDWLDAFTALILTAVTCWALYGLVLPAFP